MPSAVVMSAAVKLVGASLKAKLMVAVLLATLTSVRLLVTVTVGFTVSTVKLVELRRTSALPLPSSPAIGGDADRAGDAVERAVAGEGGGIEASG